MSNSPTTLIETLAGHAAPDPLPPIYTVVDLRELLEAQFRPRECLLSPWLTTQSLTMAYAWRGVGKTHFALNVAYAVASGGAFLGWQADKPRKVLYLDGEMPGHAIQQRLAEIGRSAEGEPPDGYFRILTPDQQEYGITPNLADHQGQREVNALIENDTTLIVVDNLSALARGAGRENDANSWDSIAAWALGLRARGIAVLFIHHSGKNGAQRGTSKKEDLLNTVLCLKRPSDYEATQGARFEIHFEKARGLMGNDVQPMEAALVTDEHGRQQWVCRSVEDSEMKRAATLKVEGASQSEIAEEMGISRHAVGRLMKRAQAEGLVQSAAFSKGGKRPVSSKPNKPYSEAERDD